jgi:aminopeptidase N
LGNKDTAFAWLEKDFQNRTATLVAWMDYVPFESLQADPRMVDLRSDRVCDYTFSSAPTDWQVRSGRWNAVNRWTCSPQWSWYGGYSPDAASAGRRALATLALLMLCLDGQARADERWPLAAAERFDAARNMTERMGALTALTESRSPLAEGALERMHAIFRGDTLVINKWFALQATMPEHDGKVFARVRQLLRHPDFSLKNPNRARSLLSTFCHANPSALHRADAAGVVFWADRVLELDTINPQIAARLARALDRWDRLAEPYRSAAHEALARVAARPGLSSDVSEIVSHALHAQR